jgi:hypothetical protein
MLDPAGRLGVQVKAGPWISFPMNAIAGAGSLAFAGEESQRKELTADLSTWDNIAIRLARVQNGSMRSGGTPRL